MIDNTEDVGLRKQVAEIVDYWDFSPLQDEDSRIERLQLEIENVVQQEVDRQKAELLDRLEHKLNGGRTYTSVRLIKEAIEAERKQLKEVSDE